MEDIEHLFIIVSGLATAFGLFLAIKGWRKARDEAIAARVRQEDAIKDIASEFKPRNGQTLAQVVTETNKDLKEHCAKADSWFHDNNAAHDVLSRRIDGLYELFGVSNGVRKTAEKHHYREEQSSE